VDPGAIIQRLWPGTDVAVEAPGAGVADHELPVAVDGSPLAPLVRAFGTRERIASDVRRAMCRAVWQDVVGPDVGLIEPVDERSERRANAHG
jgi:hypothetical protein